MGTISLDPLENTEDPNMHDPWTQDIERIAQLFNRAFMEDLSSIETEIATRLIDSGYLTIAKSNGRDRLNGRDMLLYSYYPNK